MRNLLIQIIPYHTLSNIQYKISIFNQNYCLFTFNVMYIIFSATIGERIRLENYNTVKMLSSGNRQLTFSVQKVNKKNHNILYL